MAPFVYEAADDNGVDIANIKPKSTISHVDSSNLPVADDFMYDFKYNHPLPTSDVLGIEIPTDCNAQREAEGIMAGLSDAMGKGDARAFADMFLDYGEIPPRRSLSYEIPYRANHAV
jgi:hypothetical protein